MRVGVVVGSQAPDAGGGFVFSWEIVRALCAQARQSSHQLVLLAEREAAAAAQPLAGPAGLEVRALRPRTLVDRAMGAAWRFSPLARAYLRRPGWLQAQADAERLDFVWFLNPAGEWLETPYAALVWDLQHRSLPWFPEVSRDGQWQVRESINAQFLGRASVVVTGTQVGVREIETFYGVPRERMLVLPHPTPAHALEAPAQGARQPEAAGALPDPLIVYPAQFWPHKNHAGLLRALELLEKRHGIRAGLALTGSDKGNRRWCERLADELGLSGRVAFLGFVPTPQLVALYRRAAALAYVSFGGPENLPPLEAFALGCPVVAADVPGAEEQLGDAALRVDPRSPEAIAEALARVIGERPLADTLRERGRTRARERTADGFVRGMLRWLDSFAAVRRAWPGGPAGS